MSFDYDEYGNPDFYPYEDRRAVPPTMREWIFVFVLLALGIGLSLLPFLRDQ